MTIDGWIMKTQIENNNSLVNDCYDMKEKKEKEERKMKEKNHYYNERNSELLTYESYERELNLEE